MFFGTPNALCNRFDIIGNYVSSPRTQTCQSVRWVSDSWTWAGTALNQIYNNVLQETCHWWACTYTISMHTNEAEPIRFQSNTFCACPSLGLRDERRVQNLSNEALICCMIKTLNDHWWTTLLSLIENDIASVLSSAKVTDTWAPQLMQSFMQCIRGELELTATKARYEFKLFPNLYLYACMYTYTWIYISTRTHIYLYTYIHIFTCTYIHIHMYYQVLKRMLRASVFNCLSNADSSPCEFLEVEIPHGGDRLNPL